MDSLAHTREPDGTLRPLCFTSKIHPLPHAHAVLCGTGAAGVVLEWYSILQAQTVAVDLEVLDRVAPVFLPQVWEASEIPPPGSVTIYQFGFLQREQRYAGFAYRSEKGFVSERLPYGIGVKPPDVSVQERCARFLEQEPRTEDFVDRLFVELLHALKQEDDGKQGMERVGIGGEVHVLKLKDGRFELTVAGRLSNYQGAFEAMCRALSAERDIPQ